MAAANQQEGPDLPSTAENGTTDLAGSCWQPVTTRTGEWQVIIFWNVADHLTTGLLTSPLTTAICPEAPACLLKNGALTLKSKIRTEDMAASMG